MTAARAATGAPRTAPTATSSSCPSRPPSSHPRARSGAAGSPRAAARSLDAIDNNAPAVAATVHTSTPGGRGRPAPQAKPGQDGRIPTRSNSPSSSASHPPRSCSRATSPSTPSATELAWTSSPPARPWPAASSAPATPNVNATSDTRSGAGRSGPEPPEQPGLDGGVAEPAKDRPVGVLAQRAARHLADRASGVSTARRRRPRRAGRPPAGAGSGPGGSRPRPGCNRPRWPPAAGSRTPRTGAGTRRSRSPVPSPRCLPNPTTAPSTTRTRVPSAQGQLVCAGSMSTAGSPPPAAAPARPRRRRGRR